MAAITILTGGNGKPRVTQVFSQFCRIRSMLAIAAGVTRGQWLYLTTAGRVAAGNTNSAGKQQFVGIALNTAGDGEPVDVLEEGFVDGYEISALAYGATVYANDTDGVIGTAAGTMTVAIGRVVPISDRDPATGLPSKILQIYQRPVLNLS